MPVGSGQPQTPIAVDRREQLRAWVREDFGVVLATVERVEHGADPHAELWRGVTVDGVPYAIKLSGGGTAAGLVVTAYLADHGVPGILAPVRCRSGELWSVRRGRRLSVVPWASDRRALAGQMTAEHWTSYGALLARVHAAVVTHDLASLLPYDQHLDEAVASAARELDARLNRAIADPAGSDLPDDHLVRALMIEWRGASRVVSTLLDRADRLRQVLAGDPAARVICHADPHLGNLLIGDEGRVWLIDWDDAVLAPRELDLMFVIGGVLAFAPVTEEQQSWFFEGYGAAEVDAVRLAYYRCTRALVDLLDPAGQVLLVDRYPGRERADALETVRGVLSPTGLVPLALASLRDVGLFG